MCTVSWIRSADQLDLFFNRDESRLRLPAHPPACFLQNDQRYLAAIDADAGGTWLAANEHGVVVAILNYYQKQVPLAEGNFISRGKLVTDLMDANSGGEAINRLAIGASAAEDAFNLRHYRACILLFFDPQHPPQKLVWDGRDAVKSILEEPMHPISTSSFRTDDVLATRQAAFDQLTTEGHPQPDELFAFHAHRDPDDDAYSVCMSRSDAHTVSFSRVQVRPDAVEYGYSAEGPRQLEGMVHCHIPRATADGVK